MRKLLLILALLIGASCCYAQVPIRPPKVVGDGPGSIGRKKPNPLPKPKHVMIQDLEGQINGHDYVDLGLPSRLKWAVCNVGAFSPEGYGSYFAWGEISPKDDYSESNSATFGRKLGDIAGNAQYDAARANWGGSWRLPRMNEVEELIKHCSWTWQTYEGIIGYKVTGPNGNSIFLPAAGYRSAASLSGAGVCGIYWSGSSYGNAAGACDLTFDSSKRDVGWDYRDCGRTVRAVSK